MKTRKLTLMVVVTPILFKPRRILRAHNYNPLVLNQTPLLADTGYKGKPAVGEGLICRAALKSKRVTQRTSKSWRCCKHGVSKRALQL
jgi:hypothetical protein